MEEIGKQMIKKNIVSDTVIVNEGLEVDEETQETKSPGG